MEVLSIILGILLLFFTWHDLFMTVFMIGGGAGPQSRLVADRVWRTALKIHKPGNKLSHSLMRAVGPFIVLLALATWVFEFILGWALIFIPSAFQEGNTLNFIDRFLFAGKSILGRSGNSPALVAIDSWEAVQSLAGLTGVIVVSVGLAYVLPILAAVAQKRSVAANLHALGDGADAMHELASIGDGANFTAHLVSMVPGIALCAERHRSYPVLHYFHSQDPHAALAPAVAKLTLFLKSDLSNIPKIDRAIKKPIAHAIHNLLDALSGLGLERYARQESSINFDGLDKLNIDPRNPPPEQRLPNTEWLKAYVQFDGWEWDNIIEGAEEIKDEKGQTLV